MNKSYDYDIRAGACLRLFEQGVERRSIRHEIPMGTASSGGRIDMLVLTDRIVGIEIKSARDKLTRLEEQRRAYSLACDGFLPLIDKKHLGNGSDIYSAIPWCSEEGEFLNAFGGRKPDLTAPTYSWSNDTSIAAMARLLWASETKFVAETICGGTKFKTRMSSVDWLRENARLNEVRPLVIEHLRSRVLNRWEEAFWKRFDDENPKALTDALNGERQ